MSEKQASTENPLVIFMPSGRRQRVEAGQSLLDVARQMGVAIESICGGRLTCGEVYCQGRGWPVLQTRHYVQPNEFIRTNCGRTSPAKS